MGTDIHLFVETRADIGSPWELASVKTPCSWCDDEDEREGSCWKCQGTKLKAGFSDRNYDLFGMLADVRNGRGFAGCDTGDGFIPISRPKDLPLDISVELREIHEDSGETFEDDDAYDRLHAKYGAAWLGDHSLSHLYLHELLAYDLGQTTKCRGVVSWKEFDRMMRVGKKKPEMSAGDVWGRDVRILEQVDAEEEWRREVPEVPEVPAPESLFVRLEWEETYLECANSFFTKFVPALQKLGEPHNVRIVFGFDS